MCDATKFENLMERLGNLQTLRKSRRFAYIDTEDPTGLEALFDPANGQAKYPKGYLGNSLWGAYARQKQK